MLYEGLQGSLMGAIDLQFVKKEFNFGAIPNLTPPI
jgi:hypothetical protein